MNKPKSVARQESPQYSRSRVGVAGKNIAKGKASSADFRVLENWRNSHAYIMNTFRTTLHGKAKVVKGPVTIAQRLKRKTTIIDKLETGRAKDLLTMHDLAGCRVIFRDIKDLTKYRDSLHKSRFNHKRVNDTKYDYIQNPKTSGYRGVHDVFSYYVNTVTGSAYNKLLIEIQYRTRYQHAWATAVEVSDLINKTRIKFDQNVKPDNERFFQLAAEYIARTYEKMRGPLPNLSDDDLASEMKQLEGRLRLYKALDKVQKQKTKLPISRNIVLHFGVDGLKARGFRSVAGALEYRAQLEEQYSEDDVVYVRGDKSQEISIAFNNYFQDCRNFVKYIKPIF